MAESDGVTNTAALPTPAQSTRMLTAKTPCMKQWIKDTAGLDHVLHLRPDPVLKADGDPVRLLNRHARVRLHREVHSDHAPERPDTLVGDKEHGRCLHGDPPDKLHHLKRGVRVDEFLCGSNGLLHAVREEREPDKERKRELDEVDGWQEMLSLPVKKWGCGCILINRSSVTIIVPFFGISKE